MRQLRQPAVYIMAHRPHGTLYVGVTSNLVQRVWQHREHLVSGFTDRYHVTRLVYFEVLEDMTAAIHREKKLKRWRRDWKVELIEAANPGWRDLWWEIAGL